MADDPPPQPLHPGSNVYVEQHREPFPNITLYDSGGQPHSLTTFSGSLILLHVWATWCAPCVEEMPQLQALQARYPERLRVLAISEDRAGFGAIEPFIEEYDLHGLSHYWDKGGIEFRKLRIKGLPMSFLIDANGQLIATIQGPADWLAADMAGLIMKHSTPDSP